MSLTWDDEAPVTNPAMRAHPLAGQAPVARPHLDGPALTHQSSPASLAQASPSGLFGSAFTQHSPASTPPLAPSMADRANAQAPSPASQRSSSVAPALPSDAQAIVVNGAPTTAPAGGSILAAGAAAVDVNDKRIVNGHADINQLAPFRYSWAWEYFLKANRNHWTPLEINMAQDVHDYHHKLSAAERHVFENVLAYLTTSDILAMRNIGLAVMEKMSAPELQIYQARQVYEEALHTWTYQHCIETLNLDQREIYNRYRVVPEIHGKIALANRRLERVLRSDFDLTDRANLHEFALSYLFFAAVFEGCWFYNGFSPVFALQRRGLMKGTAEQLQYIMRDEVLHCGFGIRVVKQLLLEENLTLDPAAIATMWAEAEAAETAYASYVMREPILGYSKELHVQQFRFIANRRSRQAGLPEPFPGAENALPWLDEQVNLRKEKNFFETRVTEYQTGGALAWD